MVDRYLRGSRRVKERGSLAPAAGGENTKEAGLLRIWGRTSSINVQKVLWCCAELGVAYERIEAGLQFGVVDTPEYRTRNPNALIPTIDDDGFVLWESNVIVRYLASRHGSGSLCPVDPRERYAAEKWMDWQATTLWPAFRIVFLGLVRTPPEKRDERAIEAARMETNRVLAILDGQLGSTRYVGGDAFTMGDIPLGVSLHRCFALGVERESFPNVARWYDRLAERPHFREHGMRPLT
jgi:glutathione S-transferase